MGAFFVGTFALRLSVEEILLGVVSDGEVTGGFPGDIFVLLVGLTYLFALAQDNGTVDRIVEWSMRSVTAFGLRCAPVSMRDQLARTGEASRRHRVRVPRRFATTAPTSLAATPRSLASPNAILLAFGMAGLNVRIIHDWHERRGLPDPWATELNEPPDLRSRQKQPRPRKLSLLERLTSGTDPPIGPRRRH